MQSPGPPYQGINGPSVVSTDLYVNRNYENHILSTQGLSNSYITYQSEESHSSSNPSTYSEQSHYSAGSPTSHSTHGTPSAHIQYNSSNSGNSYGQPVNQFNDMYSTCSPYAANIPPAIRQPIPTIPASNLKYWNSDQQMSHNSHNSYNQGIPPPPLVSRTPGLGSPTHRSSHNSFSASQHRSPSQSPQGWSRSPNVMHSPSTTPSPLPSHGRSPSHMPSQQFSPSHDSSHPSVQKTGISYSNQNHSSSQVNASNPLQSLQKMVMIESDGADIRTPYDNMAPTGLQNNGTVPMTANSTQKNYNSDQNLNADPESPYPTYYNMDQNRLCTPPRPNPNPTTNSNPPYANIPEARSDGFVTSGQLCESDSELKKSETNDNNSNNDLIYDLDETKAEIVRQIKAKVSLNSTVSVNGDNAVIKMDGQLTKIESSSNVSNVKTVEQPTVPVPAVCKRTASRDSLQSSDSETAHSAQHNWHLESEYYNQHSDNKNAWPQWPSNSLPKSSPNSVPQNNYLPDGRPVAPVPTSLPYQSYRPTQCGAGSWAPSASSSQSSTPNQDFAAPNLMNQSQSKKKRGRPFGSKNRRNSDDTNSETNTSDVSNPTKPKKTTEEIGINTSVSIDSHGFDELAVINPLKHRSKRKKTIGPFIRMEKGRAGKATLFSIVNASTKPEDEKDVKTKSHSTKPEPIKHIRRPSLLVSSKKVVSTLSPHYDLNTRDKTWVCALCHRGPHYKGLGDLYGPYYISVEDKNKTQTTTSSSTTTSNPSVVTTPTATTSRSNSIDEVIDSVVANEKRVRRRKSDSCEESPKVRSKQTSKTLSATQNSETEATHSPNAQTEVWVHEDCIVWSNGVYLVGHRVRNLEEVITESQEILCIKCKLSGATLGCLQKSCNNSQFHYLCAKEKGCEFNDENFSLLCPKHRKKTKITSDEPSFSKT